jgi:hypothetical protein
MTESPSNSRPKGTSRRPLRASAAASAQLYRYDLTSSEERSDSYPPSSDDESASSLQFTFPEPFPLVVHHQTKAMLFVSLPLIVCGCGTRSLRFGARVCAS